MSTRVANHITVHALKRQKLYGLGNEYRKNVSRRGMLDVNIFLFREREGEEGILDTLPENFFSMME